MSLNARDVAASIAEFSEFEVTGYRTGIAEVWRAQNRSPDNFIVNARFDGANFNTGVSLIQSHIDLTGVKKPIETIFEPSDCLRLQFRLSGKSTDCHADGSTSDVRMPSVLLTYLPKGANLHQVVSAGENWHTMTFSFPRLLVSTLLEGQRGGVEQSLKELLDSEKPMLHWQMPLTPDQRAILNGICKTPLRGALKARYLEAKSIELLCLALYDFKGADGKGDAGGIPLNQQDQSNLRLARDILSREFRTPLTLDELARRVGLNRRKLAQGFKQIFHSTVYGYCIRLRMEEARRLLVDKGICVTEVAFEVGYQDPSSFTKAFKQYFNVLPKEFRNRAFDSRDARVDL
ncbi:helix-turn-helix domain-containing protein [Exilibacterium tricleocarpae]|nr:AraC family transcriptional regulator [Exilibacterium tricleocarpae]